MSAIDMLSMLNVLAVIRRRVQGIFFGWWIVLSACVIQLLHSGLLSNGFTLYFLSLQAEFGWSRALLAAGYSLSHVETGILGPLEGWLSDRFGPRPVVVAGVVLFGAGFILLNMIQSIVAYFIAFLVISAGASLCGFLPLSVAVLNWFARKRSLALGIALSGSGLGGVIVPLLAWSIVTQGWRFTALASGFAIWLIGIPLALSLRHKPEKYGYLPDGDSPASSEGRLQEYPAADPAPRATARADDSFSMKEAVRTRAFWLIALGHGSAILTVSAVNLHLAPHLVQQLGTSLEAAGGIVTLLLMMSLTGRLGGGFLADRVNKRVLLMACMLSHSIGLLMLTYATSMTQIFLFAMLHGIAWGVRAPTLNAIRADYFGRKSIGFILGISSIAPHIASVIAPIFAGWMADVRGDYRLAFTIMASLTALGSLFFAFASKPVRKPCAVAKGAVTH
ncbi:MFS transporter [Chloroflexota bacterium]